MAYYYYYYYYDDSPNPVQYFEKQLRDILRNPDFLYNFKPPEFEAFVAEVFRRNGFEVVPTPKTHDGGKDIIAYTTRGGISFKTYIECKKYSKNLLVDISVVRAVYGTQIDDRANKSVIVTTSHFTKDARIFAEKNSMQLVDFDAFMEMLKNTPINQNSP